MRDFPHDFHNASIYYAKSQLIYLFLTWIKAQIKFHRFLFCVYVYVYEVYTSDLNKLVQEL